MQHGGKRSTGNLALSWEADGKGPGQGSRGWGAPPPGSISFIRPPGKTCTGSRGLHGAGQGTRIGGTRLMWHLPVAFCVLNSSREDSAMKWAIKTPPRAAGGWMKPPAQGRGLTQCPAHTIPTLTADTSPPAPAEPAWSAILVSGFACSRAVNVLAIHTTTRPSPERTQPPTQTMGCFQHATHVI